MAAFAVALLTLVPGSLQAQTPNSVTLTPSSGPASTSFEAYYLGPPGCPVGQVVSFYFAGSPTPYGAAPMDADCGARVTGAPATGRPPGGYPVLARWCTLACVDASATFTVTAPPTTTTTTTTIVPPSLPPPPSTTTTAATTTTTTTATTTTTVPFGIGKDPGGAELVSALAAATPGPGDADPVPAVFVTNLLLALLLLLLFGTTSAVFNSTLDAHRDRIDAWLGRVRRRIAVPLDWWHDGAGRRPGVRWATILLLTALVYGFLSPGFGFDTAGILLVLGLIAGLGALTSVSEGGAAWFASGRLGVEAAVKVHAGGLLAALACVAFTRAVGFEPAVMYGFVASTALLAPAALDRVQNGKAALYPAVWLLAAAVAAWAGLGAVRAAELGGWGGAILENVLAIVFVGGIEGTLYNLIPITFMDGRAVAEWSRGVWAGAFFVTAFVFWQLLVNPGTGYLDAFGEAGVRIALVVALGYALVTAATWTWFRLRPEPAAG